ncbi:DUF192 domain-containing protein [Nitrococcus mobilis]|uniref:DUF192 domain-containing protein n=1 Tax=Nitrococcus mobilis Nb-231 TaxID=314278 RepID=A4BN01_9GAMM|nr:DUF192 domain-containing protein [Nitrococcus mobilis]EAR22600.1 hypothetical protein NB231_09118 [Nitrococcus mobilis Nb-231]
MDKSILTVLVAGLVLVACGYGLTERPRRDVADLPVCELLIDGHAITARIGATPNDRGLGFQYATPQQIRRELIYFRYRFAQIPHFHMTNVAAPLLIAWIGPDHRVIAIERMTPGSCCYEPPTEIIAALEFAPEHPLANRIRPGTRVHPIQPPTGDLRHGEHHSQRR